MEYGSKENALQTTNRIFVYRWKKNLAKRYHEYRWIINFWVKLKLVTRIKKQISKFELTNDDLGLVITWFTTTKFDVSQNSRHLLQTIMKKQLKDNISFETTNYGRKS